MRKFWLTLEDAIREARNKSIEGGIWVIWEDWSLNEAIRVTSYEEFLQESTAADHTLRFYENGEER